MCMCCKTFASFSDDLPRKDSFLIVQGYPSYCLQRLYRSTNCTLMLAFQIPNIYHVIIGTS